MICHCHGCHKTFKPKRSKYDTYCSRECFFEMKAWRKIRSQHAEASSSAVSALLSWHHPACEYCGKDMRGKPTHKKYCSSLCLTRCNSKLGLVLYCQCGGIASIQDSNKKPGNRPRFCSSCLPSKKMEWKKSAKARRKARLRGANNLETFFPDDVFRRDKWKCQFCGIKVTRMVSVNSDQYPNLDHIIPISKGGDHTMANTQCLCRKCNLTKANNVVGQLRLC